MPATSEDGATVWPDRPYWTLTTDRVLIPDGQERVDAIAGLTVVHDGEVVPTITRGATVDGQDWMERWWSCRLDDLHHVQVTEGSDFRFVAGSGDATRIEVRFHYIDPNGLAIAYEPEPDWSIDGPVLEGRLGALREGIHDVFAGVTYSDGSAKTHHVQVEFV